MNTNCYNLNTGINFLNYFASDYDISDLLRLSGHFDSLLNENKFETHSTIMQYLMDKAEMFYGSERRAVFFKVSDTIVDELYLFIQSAFAEAFHLCIATVDPKVDSSETAGFLATLAHEALFIKAMKKCMVIKNGTIDFQPELILGSMSDLYRKFIDASKSI